MPVSRSAGIILYQNPPEGRKYLILHSKRPSNLPEFWDISKGELDPGESGIDAARRVVKEETRIEDFALNPEFKFTARYFTKRDGKTIPKFVAVFLGEVKDEKVVLSDEHDAYAWASLEEALKKLTTMKETLKKADEFLQAKSF